MFINVQLVGVWPTIVTYWSNNCLNFSRSKWKWIRKNATAIFMEYPWETMRPFVNEWFSHAKLLEASRIGFGADHFHEIGSSHSHVWPPCETSGDTLPYKMAPPSHRTVMTLIYAKSVDHSNNCSWFLSMVVPWLFLEPLNMAEHGWKKKTSCWGAPLQRLADPGLTLVTIGGY